MMLRKHNCLPYLRTIAKRLFGRITGARYVKSKTMQNKNDYGETLRQHILTAGIISAVGALAAGAIKFDQYLGTREVAEDTQAEPEMAFHHKPDNDRTLVLLGGLCMNTADLAKNCRSQLAEGVSLITPIYPETGFNPQIIFEKTYQKLEETNPKEVFVLGISMGGPMNWDLLAYGLKTGRQELVEKVSGWGMAGSPMDKKAIRFGPRTLVDMVHRRGYSYALNHSRPLLRRWNLDSIANAPSTKIVPQCMYLAGEHAGRLPISLKRVVYMRGMLPDTVVDEDRSITILEQKLGLTVEKVVNEAWTKRDHARTGKESLRFMLSQFGIAKPKEPAVVQELHPSFPMNMEQSALAA